MIVIIALAIAGSLLFALLKPPLNRIETETTALETESPARLFSNLMLPLKEVEIHSAVPEAGTPRLLVNADQIRTKPHA